MAETSGVLERRLQMRPLPDPAARALINLQVANAHFEEEFEAVTLREGLGTSAYNILRILRGAPDGHPRGEIARRMVYRRTDLTRIIDGLVRRGLVERVRTRKDRRLSLARLTPKGLKTMARLEPHVTALIARYRAKLSDQDYRDLNRILETLYGEDVE